jgi:AcrR family transcriptional regulator
LERGYAHLALNEVAKRADVGRSTVYSHFSGLNDLLAHSLDRHLFTLAQCTLKPDLDPELVKLMAHFWEQRAQARTILRGDALAAISRPLTGKLEARLVEIDRERKSRTKLPLGLLAVQISAGQLATLETWLAGRTSGSSLEIAQLLQTTTYAVAATMLQAGLGGR